MAKVTAPLLSFGASGTIAKTQTFGKWRGVPYARQHVVPANPKSAGQTQTRNSFTWLMGLWKLMPPEWQAPWVAFAQGKPLTGRNALGSQNIATLRTAATLADLVASPGAKGGSAPSAAVATPGAGNLSVAVTEPALPTGWTITECVGVCIKDQNPQTASDFNSTAVTDNATPFVIDFTGLAAGTYYWAVWFKYLKPDGTTAYGPDLHGTAIVT